MKNFLALSLLAFALSTRAYAAPISFTLPKAASVTIAIDDAKGNRVRNLVSEKSSAPESKSSIGTDSTTRASRSRRASTHGAVCIATI